MAKGNTPIEGFDISPQRRDLYFKIIDDVELTHWICPRLYFLESGFPPDKLDRALRWLVFNNYTGKRFLTWVNETAGGSNLQMHAELLRVVDNEKVERIVAGRNFRT